MRVKNDLSSMQESSFYSLKIDSCGNMESSGTSFKPQTKLLS